MTWMNRYEIDEAVDRFRRDPVLGPATKFLKAFMDEVDSHSDGWPYWTQPSKAAGKLMDLIHSRLRAGMGVYPALPRPTEADVRRTLPPIKSFMTRRGTAAGMRMPAL